jgi:hypothetical protein
MADRNINPRGIRRPHDGRGRGTGILYGLRQGRNIDSCPYDLNQNSGYGNGQGRGKGKNRL